MNDKIAAMVLAGGEGTRLNPLTVERSKPAVPFGGRYRIVDFVLSNLVNSGVFAIFLLVQYSTDSGLVVAKGDHTMFGESGGLARFL